MEEGRKLGARERKRKRESKTKNIGWEGEEAGKRRGNVTEEERKGGRKGGQQGKVCLIILTFLPQLLVPVLQLLDALLHAHGASLRGRDKSRGLLTKSDACDGHVLGDARYKGEHVHTKVKKQS